MSHHHHHKHSTTHSQHPYPFESATIIVNAYNNEQSIILTKEPIPRLTEGQILVHAAAAPISPLDILKMSGLSPFAKPPFTPGSECSGVVIDAKGANFLPLIGKKVATYSSKGCFQEYVISNADEAIILSDDVDLEQAACAYVNPLTSLGLVNVAEDQGARCIINTACNSSLGKMISKVAQTKGMEVIGLVRGQQKADDLKSELGLKQVLDITSQGFPNELGKVIKELKATVALDCVAGEMTGQLLKSLPRYGVCVNYGTLSGKPISHIDAADLRAGNKSLTGFVVMEWLKEKKKEEKEELYRFVRENLKGIFHTEIAGRVNLSEFREGLGLYKKNMSVGKIIVLLSSLVRK